MTMCPYCFKFRKDIPDHLTNSPSCRILHANKLRSQLNEVVRLSIIRKKIFNDSFNK